MTKIKNDNGVRETIRDYEKKQSAEISQDQDDYNSTINNISNGISGMMDSSAQSAKDLLSQGTSLIDRDDISEKFSEGIDMLKDKVKDGVEALKEGGHSVTELNARYERTNLIFEASTARSVVDVSETFVEIGSTLVSDPVPPSKSLNEGESLSVNVNASGELISGVGGKVSFDGGVKTSRLSKDEFSVKAQLNGTLAIGVGESIGDLGVSVKAGKGRGMSVEVRGDAKMVDNLDSSFLKLPSEMVKSDYKELRVSGKMSDFVSISAGPISTSIKADQQITYIDRPNGKNSLELSFGIEKNAAAGIPFQVHVPDSKLKITKFQMKGRVQATLVIRDDRVGLRLTAKGSASLGGEKVGVVANAQIKDLSLLGMKEDEISDILSTGEFDYEKHGVKFKMDLTRTRNIKSTGIQTPFGGTLVEKTAVSHQNLLRM